MIFPRNCYKLIFNWKKEIEREKERERESERQIEIEFVWHLFERKREITNGKRNKEKKEWYK